MIRQRPLLVSLAVTVPVVEYMAARLGGPGPSLAVVRNPFAAIAVASVLCRYILFFDSRERSRKWILGLAPLVMAIGLVGQRSEPIQIAAMNTMVALGVLGVLGFILAALHAEDRHDKAERWGRLMDALLLPMAASMVSFGLWLTSRINPVYDTRVYNFEQILGAKFSLLAVRSYHLFSPLSGLASACYGIVALGVVLVAATQATVRQERDVLTAVVVAGACGFALYFVCPVVGPFQAFGPPSAADWPSLRAGGALMIAALGPPRNGMPSLHTAWALLIWFNAQPLPVRLRRALRLFAIMTLWATMGLEEHWLMDIVVGVPLAGAIQSGLVRDEARGRRWLDATVCAALTAAWLIGFRTGNALLQLPMSAAWLAVAATVWWPLSRQRGTMIIPVLESTHVEIGQHHPVAVLVDH